MPFCRVSPARPGAGGRTRRPRKLRTRQRIPDSPAGGGGFCRSPPAGPAPPPPACRGDGGESPCPAGRRRRRRPPRWPPPEPASPGGVSRRTASGGQQQEIVHHKVEQEQLIQIDHRHPASPLSSGLSFPIIEGHVHKKGQIRDGQKKKLTRCAHQLLSVTRSAAPGS